ncbi:MAG: GTPase ObgE [Candidatus Kapabacteria bacterium]|nr:GTPase ObgE [Candidatus Kapabacteria bacterium]
MKFIDLAKIVIKSGDGGNGHISFRREKYVPKGGPDGGNGGKGGDVVFVVDPNLNTLLDFKYKRFYKAENGKPGGKSNKTGKNGKDIIIKVPPGTIIKDAVTEEVIADLSLNSDKVTVLYGGAGGKGNAEFATPTNQTPRYAEEGKPGEELEVILELKLIADVGIVGMPNAGKSTLISVISAAKPKIADYPFTTLIPNLGIVKIDLDKSFVVADIPGLIENASEGKGLGIQFLRHVERTNVLVFLIDSLSENPKKDYKILLNELKKYNPKMLEKNRIICLSKVDALTEEDRKKLTKLSFGKYEPKPLLISSVSGESIDKLKKMLWEIIESS